MRPTTGPPGGRARSLLDSVSVSTEVHLRRMKVQPALIKLERYLREAAAAGVPWVRIIHGKGTGTMRRAIVEHITDHPMVRSHSPASPAEGGGGVTVARLRRG